MVKIAVLSDAASGETRVAASPETVKKYVHKGWSVAVVSGAGHFSGFSDAAYAEVGADVVSSASAALKGAHVVLSVQRPDAALIPSFVKGALLLCMANPYHADAILAKWAKKVDLVALEFVPRITRAQSMDVLSSQANLAGYRAVVDAAALFGRALPMMMTAAGTVPAARVFVMGAGVAGLQAIATARRLGAVVTATDVRPAAKEQVASLGAKFVAVEDEEFLAAETTAGYAKPMSEAYQQKQAALVAEHIKTQDIIITTAQIPGRIAPRLLTKAMIETLKPGSVVMDLAVDHGGNCELSVPGQVVDAGGVQVAGYLNIPGRLAASTSQLFARNVAAYLEALLEVIDDTIALKADDDIVKATRLSHGGVLVHPQFGGVA